MQEYFHNFLIFNIWQCRIFNDSVIPPYNSQCDDRHGTVLLEKFSYCLNEINQSSYYALLEKMEMLYLDPEVQ